jgi:hypothetical protein
MKKHRSKALMVHPKQAARFEEQAQKMGIPVEYDRKTGECKGRGDDVLMEAARRGFYETNSGNDKANKIYEAYIKGVQESGG